MKKLLINFKLLTVLFSGMLSLNTKAMGKKSWIYFDLGDTIVNLKSEDGIDYFKGSKQYIKTLKDKGYRIGIISNIPESFGMDYEEKLDTLKNYLKKNWVGEEEFDWTLFDEIFLPLNNSQLKPAEILYHKAMQRAEFCPMAYISENNVEVEKARELGIAGHNFDKFHPNLYIPMEDVQSFLDQNYHNEIPGDCE